MGTQTPNFDLWKPDLDGDKGQWGYMINLNWDVLDALLASMVIDPADIDNWNTAYSWGDHALAGYLTSFTETDPVFAASPAAGITAPDIVNWDLAFGWGDHASGGYLLADGSEPVTGSSLDRDVDDDSLEIRGGNGTGAYVRVYGGSHIANPFNVDINGVLLYTALASEWVFPVSDVKIALGNLYVDEIREYTTAAGVTVDGVLIKDGLVDGYDVSVVGGWGDHSTAGYLTGITAQSIKNLSDVWASMSPTNGQVLTWDNANSRWTASDASGGGADLTANETVTGLWSFSNASGLKTNTITERTAASGVTIDSVLLKDGDVVLPSSGVIDFSNAQTSTVETGAVTTSEDFDHYEEGTWEPVVTDLTNACTMGTQNGFYVKIGRMVYVTAYFTWSSKGSMTGGQVYIDGFPFQINFLGGNGGVGTIHGTDFTITAGRSVQSRGVEFNRRCYLEVYDSSAGMTGLQSSELQSSGSMRMSLTYFV